MASEPAPPEASSPPGDTRVFKWLPRANTNLPTTAVADRIAALLASRGSAAI